MSRKQALLLANATLGAAALACLVLHLAGYQLTLRGPPFVAVLPNASTVEKHGVRLTVTAVKSHGDCYRVSYALERTDDVGRRILGRPGLPLLVKFWDDQDNLIHVQLDKAEFGKDFADGRTCLLETKCYVNPPFPSRFLSLTLGPGLTTGKCPIPGR